MLFCVKTEEMNKTDADTERTNDWRHQLEVKSSCNVLFFKYELSLFFLKLVSFISAQGLTSV